MYGLLTGSDQPAQGCLPIQFRFGSHPAKSDWGLLSFPINNPATHIVSPFLRTKKSLFCLTQTKETLFFQPMPQPGFSFSHHREQEVSPPLFIQQKTLYPTKVFLPSLLLSMSSRQARAVSLRVCNAPCTMQALLSKACCVPTVVLSGSLRSNRVLTGTAAPQPTLPGLPGLDRCCRGCWRPPGPSGTCLLPFCIVQLSWPSPCVLGTTDSQPPTLFLVFKTGYFPFCTSGTVKGLHRPARAVHPLCGAQENILLLSHAAQGVYQTYI